MNTIESSLATIEMGRAYRGFRLLMIDGHELGRLLATADGRFPENSVPTLNGCWIDQHTKIVAQRMLSPPPGCTSIAPILMCAECKDLDCGVVMVEIEADGDVIRWRRFGFDRSDSHPPIGTCVEWVVGPGPFLFQREEYELVLGEF